MTNPYTPPATISVGLREVPPSAVPAQPAIGTIVLAQGKNGPIWNLVLDRHEAWLVPPAGDPATVLTHEEFGDHVQFLITTSVLLLTVKGLRGRGSVGLQGNAESMGTLRSWMAQRADLHIQKVLKKRIRFSLPLGIFLVASASPILGTNFDPFVLVGGIGCIALALLATRYPRPILLLVDALVWLFLGVSNAVGWYRTSSKLSLVLAIAMAFFTVATLKLYRFFRDLERAR